MISVIMLTYNRENMVSRAIDSILNQSYKNFEFIIIDNGSTDMSGQIADEYALKDNRIKVAHIQKSSISCGRNNGLDLANGDYIAFIDDDDYCERDFLEFLFLLITENDADIAICGDASKSFDIKKIMSAEDAIVELMRRNYYNVAFPTKLIASKLFSDEKFPEDRTFDDISLMYRILAKASKVAYHGIPKYTFYRHDNNNSAWTTNHSLLTKEILSEYLIVYRERTKWLSDIFVKKSAVFEYFEFSFMISMVEKITRLNISDCFDIKAEMICILRKNKDAFLNSPEIADFEIGWYREYVGD